MAYKVTLDDYDRAAAEEVVSRHYRDMVVTQNSFLHIAGNLPKSLLGQVAIAVASTIVAGAVATVAVPGLAIVAAGASAALIVAYSRNKERELRYLVQDTIAEKKKSGAFDQNVRVEMVMMAEQQMRLRSELGGDAVRQVKASMDAGAVFNDRTLRSPPTGMPLTGATPAVSAAMRMR